MTTCLYSLLSLPVLTAGGDRMAQTDPHGWTLTFISVSVVFAALIVLYFIYNFTGKIFSGELKAAARKAKRAVTPGSDREAEVAAAIALALDMEQDGDTYAAIAAAVHLYLSDAVHDVEPGIVTIVRKDSAWNNKALNFRKLPK
ncbi:MAG: OadG family protein [Bacteroidales bacterium]|nr:OadG family protein [Bacteroidales bacterium]